MAGEGESKTIRAFVAVELGDSIRQALGELEARLKRAPLARIGRWVAPGSMHLTLKFLGDVPAAQVPELLKALSQATVGMAPFEMAIAGLGCFPNGGYPRVVWVGIDEPTGSLERLQLAVERELNRLGFRPEGRNFTPHLTLARVRDQARRRERAELGAWLEQQQVGRLGAVRVSQVALMRSTLRPDGAVYTRLGAAPLQPAEA